MSGRISLLKLGSGRGDEADRLTWSPPALLLCYSMRFSEFVADGLVDTSLVTVESGSAISAALPLPYPGEGDDGFSATCGPDA